ncbi:MAG TPA: thiamine pyrophosphate-dependent enzyme, partial [Clostridia bacterium]
PKDVTVHQTEYEPLPRFVPRPDPIPDPEAVATLRQWLAESSRPLIYAGGGVVSSGSSETLLELSRRAATPVCTSIMGLTALPSDYILNLGMVGMHGTPAANKATHECDLLIAIGTRFSDRVAGKRDDFARDSRIVHIDIDSSEIDKNILTQLSITGNAAVVLDMLLDGMKPLEHPEWVHSLVRYKAQNTLPMPTSGGCLNPRDILIPLAGMAGEDAIIVTDVGQHQMLTAQYYRFSRPRSFVSSCGLGAMGFGLGAAIGAKVANPDRPVILVTGDGSFHMNLNEMATAVSENLPIVVLIMNNGVLGLVRQWQKMFYHSRYSATSIGRVTDYVKLAEAFGAIGYRIQSKAEIRDVLRAALDSGRPCVVDCVTDCDDGVFPMIPPGGSARDIIFSD